MLNEKIIFEEQLPVKLQVLNIKEWNTHYHDDIEVVYVLKGEIELKNVHYTYALKPGNVFVLNDSEMHSISAKDKNMVLVVHLQLKYFINYFEELYNSFFITDISDEDKSMNVLRKNLLALLSEYMIKDSNYERRMIGYANNLLSCLIADFRYFTLEEGMFKNRSDYRGNEVLAERLYRVTDYIYENHSERITLSEVAQNVHLSDYYLSHLIKTFTGLSFQDYLNFARVEKSEKLLLETGKSISFIAEECGFSAVRYYTKFFERWFGVTPKEYRKQYLEKVESSKGKLTYTEYDEGSIMKFLKKEHSEVLLGIRQIKKINIESIDIDIDQRKKGLSEYIRKSIAFYCDIETLGYYFDEIISACNDLVMDYLTIRIKEQIFSFKDISRLLNMGINISFEINETNKEKDEIAKRLYKRYGELTDIVYQKNDWEKEEKNYIYDSAIIIPYILKDITIDHKKKQYRLIDREKSTSLTNGESGILNFSGLRKPAYYAFKMLSDLIVGEIIDLGEGYIASKKDNTIRILIYSKVHKWRKYSDPAELMRTMEGEIDLDEKIIKLHGISGKLRVQYYYYENRNALFNVHGNLGFRDFLTKEEEDFVRWVTVPETGFFETEAVGMFTLNIKMASNSAYLYIITSEEK